MIADVVMPEMGGVELSRRLAETRPEVQTLYISGYPDEAISSRGVLESGGLFLQKPFRPATLLARVRAVLAGREGGSAACSPAEGELAQG